MSEQYYVTRRGLRLLQEKAQKLEEELSQLESQVAHAAEVGGNQYHDNSSYEMLVIDIRGIDKRLQDARSELNRVSLIDPVKTASNVAIGVTVCILVDGEEQKWTIVGFGESDPDAGLISYNTPLAKLIICKKTGDRVVGMVGDRRVTIEILGIELSKEA